MDINTLAGGKHHYLAPTEIKTETGAYALAKNINERIENIIKIMESRALKIDDKAIENMNNLMGKILLRSFGMDTFFKHFEVNDNNKHLENMISIIVYDEKNIITYANDTYLEAVGIESMDELLTLSKNGKLLERVYSGKNLIKVKEMVSILFKDGGYINEVFVTNTGTHLMFNTIMNQDKTGSSIRVGINLNKLGGVQNYVKCACSAPSKKLDLHDIVHDRLPIKFDKLFRSEAEKKTKEDKKPKVDELHLDFLKSLDSAGLTAESPIDEDNTIDEPSTEVTPHSEFKRVFDESAFGKLFYQDIIKLSDLASIGDILVNWGPQPVFFAAHNEMLANNRFCELSGYSSSEIAIFHKNNTLWEKLIGKEQYEALKNDIEELPLMKDVSKMIPVIRKDGLIVDIIWNIYKYDNTGGIFWTGVVASAIKLGEEK